MRRRPGRRPVRRVARRRAAAPAGDVPRWSGNASKHGVGRHDTVHLRGHRTRSQTWASRPSSGRGTRSRSRCSTKARA
ncbi:hypothetical protein DCW30_17105 [Streptomyces alfalfae]|nr:hypothetical protein D3X13_32590 [Streptomyces fradiae]RXX42730.1 hypothetical protein DCW30_17105 [Streptomyces alfalfae]RZM86443.1 hypothetical protein D4104_30385 [Streptomyces alfalfae]